MSGEKRKVTARHYPLNVPEGPLTGYSWELENPRAVVCIIHGIGEHAARYERVASLMREEGIAVLSMDLPGHGLSGGKKGHCAPRIRILAYVDELIREAGRRYPGVPLFVYGHSMGGNIALDYRRRGEQNQIPEAYIVTSPWILLKKPVPRTLVRVLEMGESLISKVPVSAGIKPDKLGNKKNYDSQPGKEMLHNVITVSTALDAIRAGEEILETEDQGKKLLLMHGTADYICDIEGSRKFCRISRNCEFVEWPGYFHEIHNGNKTEDGTEVIRYMIDWIKNQV